LLKTLFNKVRDKGKIVSGWGGEGGDGGLGKE
jgi:hypothetical protein